MTCGGSNGFCVPWKLINPNETDSLTAWHAACGPRWSEIMALQPLIYRLGTLHCSAWVASAGAFHNGLYWVLQYALQHSPNHHGLQIIFLLCRPWWMKQQFTVFLCGFSVLRQSIHFSITFKVFTSDEQLKSKLHLTRNVIIAKPVSPNIILSSICLSFYSEVAYLVVKARFCNFIIETETYWANAKANTWFSWAQNFLFLH